MINPPVLHNQWFYCRVTLCFLTRDGMISFIQTIIETASQLLFIVKKLDHNITEPLMFSLKLLSY